ncbi:PTS sugar transporter subunit IIA [Candidatus Latescibacterota bacterium]
MNPLNEVIDKRRILFLECETKEKALKDLINNLSDATENSDREELIKGIFYREELMSTGIGLGIAVPHVRLTSVKKMVMSVGICKNSITDYETLDGLPVNFIFMIVAGKEQHEKYLKILSTISSLLKEETLRTKLLRVESVDEFYSLLMGKES